MRRLAAELGSLAVTAAVQRAALFAEPGPAWSVSGTTATSGLIPFWTAQWYVVLAAVLGVLRYRSGHDDCRQALRWALPPGCSRWAASW